MIDQAPTGVFLVWTGSLGQCDRGSSTVSSRSSFNFCWTNKTSRHDYQMAGLPPPMHGVVRPSVLSPFTRRIDRADWSAFTKRYSLEGVGAVRSFAAPLQHVRLSTDSLRLGSLLQAINCHLESCSVHRKSWLQAPSLRRAPASQRCDATEPGGGETNLSPCRNGIRLINSAP